MSVIQARAFFPTTGTAGNRPQNEDTAKEPAEAAAQLARHYCDQVVPMMESIRLTIDVLEQNTASDFWPFPTYGELLFA